MVNDDVGNKQVLKTEEAEKMESEEDEKKLEKVMRSKSAIVSKKDSKKDI